MKKDTKMELDEINHVVVEQICKLFDVPPDSILTISNIKDWDSINHINLMVMIEDVFEINLCCLGFLQTKLSFPYKRFKPLGEISSTP